MDLEGYAKRAMRAGNISGAELAEKLTHRIMEIKVHMTRDEAEALANAVISEARTSLNAASSNKILALHECGVSMGDFGVGSRGEGDFYTHEKIAEVIGSTGAVVDSGHLDDSGVVRAGGQYLVLTVDGMHSRLSDYPFLAGFHVTRAALRDIYVMGARPVALFSDIHVADDGDVSKIFDHVAGISAVGEVMNVPLITGSTLRIGGDMVIGERMTGCVGAVGIADSITPRMDAEPGDTIIMSEGAGGGTISTTAIYYGMPEVVEETLNVRFLTACEVLMNAGLTDSIHCMTDVTNGGLRGDCVEIARTAGAKLVVQESAIRGLVNRQVMEMLETHEIDYLGVSLDALLIMAPENAAEGIISTLGEAGVSACRIGRVESGSGTALVVDGAETDFTHKFRESAYTPIKKVVGETARRDRDEMKRLIDGAARAAVEKKQRLVEKLSARE